MKNVASVVFIVIVAAVGLVIAGMALEAGGKILGTIVVVGVVLFVLKLISAESQRRNKEWLKNEGWNDQQQEDEGWRERHEEMVRQKYERWKHQGEERSSETTTTVPSRRGDYPDEKGRPRCGMCGKLLFETESDADKAIIQAARYGRPFRAYYDNNCGYWHLTSQTY